MSLKKTSWIVPILFLTLAGAMVWVGLQNSSPQKETSKSLPEIYPSLSSSQAWKELLILKQKQSCTEAISIKYYFPGQVTESQVLKSSLNPDQQKLLEEAIDFLKYSKHTEKCTQKNFIVIEIFYDSQSKVLNLQWNDYDQKSNNKIGEFAIQK